MFLKPCQALAHQVHVTCYFSTFDHIVHSYSVPGQLAGLATVRIGDSLERMLRLWIL